jgi:ribosomal protein L37AE/L43A
MLSTEIRRDERGVDRCSRKVFTAVQKVTGDDSKGYKNVEAICNQPIVQRISDGVKGCPRCDKEPAVGNVHPKVTNASQTSLTPKEMEECGLNPDGTRIDGKILPVKSVETEVLPVEGIKVSEIKKDEIVLSVPLIALEDNEDVAAFLIKKASEALDDLPVTNFKESKRLIKLQERLESLLKV